MKNRLLVILIFIFGIVSNSISAFTFTTAEVVITNGTCVSNGSLTFNPTGTVAGSTMNYLVYKLPNTSTPYSNQTTNTLSSLAPATYRIIATENVGGTISAPQQVDVTITTSFVSLTYSLDDLNNGCVATTSNVTVNIITGTGAMYGILSGPMTFPYQASNVFNNLLPGTYTFSVIDDCGNSLSQNKTIIINAPGLNIASPTFSDSVPADCNTINIKNLVTPSTGTVLNYPLTIQYTINPPVGAPIIINTTLASGGATSQLVTQSIPFYPNATYSYDIQITDNCGTVHPIKNFTVVDNLSISETEVTGNCGNKYFQINVAGFTPSYSLNFTTAPATFNPNTANASYPNYSTSNPIYFGDIATSMPLGNYTVQVTDACGSTKTISFVLTNIAIPPSVTTTNNGCLSNSGKIIMTAGAATRKIVVAIIQTAPATYVNALPHNVSANINSLGILTLNNVPLGNYTIEVTDDCGVTTILPVVVPIYLDLGVAVEVRPGCDSGKTSIAVYSNNGKLTSVKITAAPAGFAFALPYNAVANILTSKSSMLMNDLPAGNYTIEVVDECGFVNILTNYPIAAYVETSRSFSFVKGCGNYNIPINFVSNAALESFWLQKEITPGVWGNPITNAIYTDGTTPNTTNSLQLSNSTTANINYPYAGTFRIVRNFLTYYNGAELNSGTVTTTNKNCLETLSPTFYFNDVLELVDINRAACTPSGIADVVVTATGAPPLEYSIIDAAYNVILNNGTSNIFSGLPVGTYKFQVKDACSNTKNRDFDIATLSPLVTINAHPDMVKCVTTILGNERFDLTPQTTLILGTLDPTKYTITYFDSLTKAQTNTNSIPNPTNYDPPVFNNTVYARVVFNQLPNCYEITSFRLIAGETPRVNLNPSYLECATGKVTLDASIGNATTTTYNWSTGATTPSITVNQVGTTNLTVTATNWFGTVACSSVPKNIKITISEVPKINHIDTIDWTDNNNSIAISTSTTGNYEYSIDGFNYQSSNSFGNLTPGVYTVYVNDINKCGSDTETIWLLYYPKFFTPNNDGVNDYWNIPNSKYEKNLQIFIYDRYGKLVSSFPSYNIGWDGNYNNTQLPSDDYWFVVTRQDGRTHKGHFAMKR